MKENPGLSFTLMKVLVVGEAAVGKSSLLYRYTQESFNGTYINTIG